MLVVWDTTAGQDTGKIALSWVASPSTGKVINKCLMHNMSYLEDGKGAVPEKKQDPRHYGYEDYAVMAGLKDFDWEKGFDIRNVLGADIDIKDQEKSLSCVGQGWSYQIWVYEVLELMEKYQTDLKGLYEQHGSEVAEVSAKAIYSQIALSNGGAYIYKGAKLVCNWGALSEMLVPSHKEDGSVDEEFMRDLSWQSEHLDRLAKILAGKDYRVIRSQDSIDSYAQAIEANFGVVGGVLGQNGHGWGSSERPTPPVLSAGKVWGHCLWFGAAGTDQYGKFMATPNSWGKKKWMPSKKWKPGDPVGYGWQKIYVDYVKAEFMFDPWTYTDKLNINPKIMENDFVKIVKDEDSPAVGFFIPMTSPEALKTMALVYNKEIIKKSDGSIDWGATIEGSVKLK